MKNKSAILVSALGIALAAGMVWQGGIVQAQSAAAPATRIAVVDTVAIVLKMIDSDRFKAPRDQFSADQKAKQDKLFAEFQAIQDEVKKKVDEAKTEEEKAKIEAEAGPKGENLKAQYQAMQGEGERFGTNQLADAFDVVAQAAEAVAHQRGYTHVLSSKLGSLDREKGSQAAFQEVLLRSTLVAPKGDDITELVIKELKLDAPAAAPAPAAHPSDAAPVPPAKAADPK